MTTTNMFLNFGGKWDSFPKAAIHTTRLVWSNHQHKHNLCLLEVDFANAFDECDCHTFLESIALHFSEIYGWVQLCYCTPSKLRFEHYQLHSSMGVQQGDSLGSLLFSFSLFKLLEDISLSPDIILYLWYLDDGVIMGPLRRLSVSTTKL